MTTPAIWPITIWKGDTFDLSVNWRDPNGNLYALSGKTARMRFYRSNVDRTIVKEITHASGITLGNVQFNIVARLTPEETAALVFDNNLGFHTLEILDVGNDDAFRLLEGSARLKA